MQREGASTGLTRMGSRVQVSWSGDEQSWMISCFWGWPHWRWMWEMVWHILCFETAGLRVFASWAFSLDGGELREM